MASDFFHTGDVVDQVINVLRGADGDTHTGGLPANWFAPTADGDEVPLKILQHGDLADYVNADSVLAITPAILVRGLGTAMDTRHLGKYVTREPVRIIHVRKFDDCRDSNGGHEKNMTKARERYAKAIHQVLWNDPHLRLATIDSTDARTEADLTTATIHDVRLVGWDLGYDAGSSYSMQEIARWRGQTAGLRAWAIGCQIDVKLKSE